MKYKIFYIVNIILFISCKEKNSEVVAAAQNETQTQCSLENAERTILALEEVKAKAKIIDSISKGKKGISFMSDSLEIDGKSFYELKVGYNSEIRFENYYTFYVEKNNCNTIRIADVVDGTMPTLAEWRKNNPETVKEATLTTSNCIASTSVKLPYKKTIDPKKAQYSTLNCTVQGINEFICDTENKRYISLPDFKNIKVILVPMDCGDFNYRYYLLTILNNKLVSNKYVEGEWYEPEDDSYKESTAFSIDENYIISIITNATENGKTTLKEKEMIQIKADGTFAKAK